MPQRYFVPRFPKKAQKRNSIPAVGFVIYPGGFPFLSSKVSSWSPGWGRGQAEPFESISPWVSYLHLQSRRRKKEMNGCHMIKVTQLMEKVISSLIYYNTVLYNLMMALRKHQLSTNMMPLSVCWRRLAVVPSYTG